VTSGNHHSRVQLNASTGRNSRRTLVEYYCGPYASRIPDDSVHRRFAYCIPPPVGSSNSTEKATEVKLREEALRQAELRYDVDAADALLSKDFVLTAASDGSLRNKSEFLPMIGDKSNPLEVLEYGGMQIRVYGDTAVVLSTIHEKADYGGKPVEFRGRRTAVWVQQNKRWVCVTIHASSFPPK
jgi:ketosteroid isomerase-like protein